MARALAVFGGAVSDEAYLTVRQAEDQRAGALLGLMSFTPYEYWASQLGYDARVLFASSAQAFVGPAVGLSGLGTLNALGGVGMSGLNWVNNMDPYGASLSTQGEPGELVEDQQRSIGKARVRRLGSAFGFAGLSAFNGLMAVAPGSSLVQRLGAAGFGVYNGALAYSQTNHAGTDKREELSATLAAEAANEPGYVEAADNFREAHQEFLGALSDFGDELMVGIAEHPTRQTKRFVHKFGDQPTDRQFGPWVYGAYLTGQRENERSLTRRTAMSIQINKIATDLRKATPTRSMGI